MSEEQYFFELSEWRDAFATYYRKRCGERFYDDDGRYLGRREGDPSFVLLISTGQATAGYWIERDAEADDETHVYSTLREVRNLERRVKRAVERNQGRVIGLIT